MIIQVGVHLYIVKYDNSANPNMHNGLVLSIVGILKHFMSSTTEYGVRRLFNNRINKVVLNNTL